MTPVAPILETTRALVRLALPVVAVQVGMMSMGVVDTIMVGHVSAADLAAVALGNLYFFTTAIFGVGILMALDPVVAQGVGAGDDAAIARGVQRGLIVTAGLTIFTSLLLAPAAPLLHVLRQPDDVVPIAGRYALTLIPGMLPFFAFVVFRQTLQAMKWVAPIVIVTLAANVVNVIFNWVLVFGKLGFPAMGAVGSGWATSLSRWLMALGLLILAWRRIVPFVFPFRREALAWAPLARMLKLGTPIGIQYQLEFGAFGVTALLMGTLGTIEMAAHQVAISIASLTFMVPLGIGGAGAVLVGQAIGREDAAAARRAAGIALALGATFMVLSAAVMLTFPGAIARMYTEERPVILLAASLIPIAGMFQVFDGTQVVAAGVLRGAGDTRAPMVITLIGFWMIGLPVSVALGFGTRAGPRGLWWGLVVGLGVVAAFLLVRVRSRFRRDLRRVVIDEEPETA